MKKSMAFLLLSVLSLLHSSVVYRELHLPADELPLLLESWPSAVLLPQSEFVALLARKRLVADLPAPVSAVLSAGRLEMTVQADRALLSWCGEAVIPGSGWQTLRLASAGITWHGMEAERQSLYVSGHDADGLEVLLTQGGEAFRLYGECLVERQAAQCRLRFQLPAAAVQNWILRADGDVVIRSGGRVLERRYDHAQQTTTFTLLPERGAVDLILSQNDRHQQNERLLTAASVLQLVISGQEEQLQAETTFMVSHLPCATFRFRLPEAMEVLEVTCADGRIDSWRREGSGELQIELHEPVLHTVRMQIRAVRPFLGRNWNFTDFQPLDCYSLVCRGVVWLSRRLQAESVVGEGVLFRALPESSDPAVESMPWLAFQGSEGYRLQAALVPVTTELAVKLEADCYVDEAGQRLQLQLTLEARGDHYVETGLRLPPGWQPEPGMAVGGSLERDGDAFRLLPSGGCPPGESRKMTLAFKHTLSDWFAGWEEARTFTFPAIELAGVVWRGGIQRLYLQGDVRGELVASAGCRVTTLESQATGWLTAAVFGSAPGVLEWRLTVPPPRLSGETYSRFQVENDRLMVTHELFWRIADSHVSQITFRLPAGTPEALTLHGEPVAIRDYNSTVEADGRRLFQVHLAGRVIGDQRISVVYPLSVSWPAGKVRLPIPVLGGVSYQSGRLAVEGHPEYQVEISGAPRRIDAGELSGMSARPGKRLLGCYAYLGELPGISVQATRQDVVPLPACLVQHCRIDTLVSTNGRRQSTAEYQLRPNLNVLSLRLPADAVLWGVTLDDKPAILLDKNGELTVQMSEGRPGVLRRLKVSWENPGMVFAIFGSADNDLPVLFYVAADGTSQPVPIADAHWQIYHPENYRLLFTCGGVARVVGAEPSRPAVGLVRLFYRCLGGINPTHGFPGCMVLPALSAAREKARYASKLYANKIMAEESSFGAADMMSAPQEEGAKKNEAFGRKSLRLPLNTTGRSLNIRLGRQVGGVSLQTLGGTGDCRLIFARASVWRAFQRALVLFFIIAGLWLFRKSWRTRLFFAGGVMIGSGLLPCLPGCAVLGEVMNPLFILSFIFLVGCLLRDSLLRLSRRTVMLLLFVLTGACPLLAAPAPTSFRQWEPRPLVLPDDAVIIPYGMDGLPSGQVLVPRPLYESLQPERTEVSPSRDFAALPVVYRGAPTEADGLVLHGTLRVRIFRSGPVLLPALPFSGALLETVQVDGRPASVWQEGENLRLVLNGRGEHEVTLQLRCPIRKQAGWYQASVRLPVLNGLGSLRLENVPAGWELLVASAAGEWSRAAEPVAAEVPLGLDGQELRLQWRQAANQSSADTTLQVESEMYLRLAAESATLTWEPTFHFQDRGRTSFDLDIPDNWRIREIAGDAIRGWELLTNVSVDFPAPSLVTPGTGSLMVGRQRIRVYLLRPAEDGERLSLQLLSRRVGVTAPPQRWYFPALTVPGVQRHRALVLARCVEAGVEATAEFAFPLQRTDPGRSRLAGSESDWEAWLAPGEPVALAFALTPRPSRLQAVLQLVQELTEDGQQLSGTWQLSRAAGENAGAVMLCPPGFTLDFLQGEGVRSWNPVAHADGPAIQLWFSDPQRLERKVTFSGRVPVVLEADGRYALACFRLSEYAEQRTVLAVQAPDGWSLREEACRGIESVLPGTLNAWLRNRRPVCLAFNARQADYSGVVQAVSAIPELSGTVIQVLRLTAQGLEQTLDFALHSQGRISALTIELPAYWRDTTPHVSGLRSCTYADIPETPGQVRCQLLFAVPLQGAFGLRLQTWRLPAVTGEALHFPQLSGKLQHYVFVENSGRDELVLQADTGLIPLRLREGLPVDVKARLASGSGQAWEAGDGRLTAVLRLRPREEVETVGARIGLASTIIVLDGSGSCLLEQTLHIDNRTEQFIDIELPVACRLLTVRVAGDLVKPLLRSAVESTLVTLPLVKTAEGDLDYQVVLTCRADLPKPGWGSRWRMPLLHVRAINIERSQVELRLPQALRWFAVAGSFGSEAGSSLYGYERQQYQQQQVQRLNQALQSSNRFVQERALYNAQKFQEQKRFVEEDASPLSNELRVRVEKLAEQRQRKETDKPSATSVSSDDKIRLDRSAVMEQEPVVTSAPSPASQSGIHIAKEKALRLSTAVTLSDVGMALGGGAAGPANQAGLELQLPDNSDERWQTLFFTCPRGASELSLWVVPAKVVRSGQDLAWLLAVLAVVAVFFSDRMRVRLRRAIKPLGNRRLLVWGGILSILLGVFPVLGMVVLVGLILTRLYRKIKRRRQSA